MMNFPSQLIEDAVNEFAKLPGVGKKTALRLVLHLLQEDKQEVEQFGNALIKMRQEIKYCSKCHNVSDQEVCHICSDSSRDHSLVCVVESIRDVMAIEQTGQFNGVYHVLGGIISPVDGIGPENLTIESLVNRCQEEDIREIMMGISPTMEGDTTIFYISRQLEGQDVKITSIARGISFGGDLEYTDEQTLARSIATRMPYESYLNNNGQG